jgi:hypothetical protein
VKCGGGSMRFRFIMRSTVFFRVYHFVFNYSISKVWMFSQGMAES